MADIINFLFAHWALTLAFIILLVAIFYVETNANVGGIRLISTQDLTNLLNRDHAVLLDVRSKKEYQSGHIAGSINVVAEQFDELLKKRLQKHKNKKVIITCNNGQQISKYGEKLKKAGFAQLFGLRGGMATWRSNGLPEVK